jgi:hypothetical protein
MCSIAYISVASVGFVFRLIAFAVSRVGLVRGLLGFSLRFVGFSPARSCIRDDKIGRAPAQL